MFNYISILHQSKFWWSCYWNSIISDKSLCMRCNWKPDSNFYILYNKCRIISNVRIILLLTVRILERYPSWYWISSEKLRRMCKTLQKFSLNYYTSMGRFGNKLGTLSHLLSCINWSLLFFNVCRCKIKMDTDMCSKRFC